MIEHKDPTDILKTIEQEMDTDIHPFLKKILENIKPIGLAMGGIVLLVAAYSGFSAYQTSQSEKTQAEIGAILILPDAGQRTEGLAKLAQTSPKNVQPAINLELAKLYMDAGAFEKAAAAWQVAGQAPGLKSVAGLGQAKALMLGGDYATAVTLLSALKKDASKELGALLSTNLAFAAEKAGQIELALTEYEALKALGGGSAAFLDFKINQLKSKKS